MEEIQQTKDMMELFSSVGLPGLLLFLVNKLWGRLDKLEHYFRLLLRMIARRKRYTIDIKDVTQHSYFEDLEGVILRASITKFYNSSGGDRTKFKMYIADVTILVNHFMFREGLSDYLKKGDFKNLSEDVIELLNLISNDSYTILCQLLNEDIASVYKESTKVFREVYFEAIHTVIKIDKVPSIIRAYMLLDLLQYRIHNSHTILYKTSLEMNGRVESQINQVNQLTKQDIINTLNKYKNG